MRLTKQEIAQRRIGVISLAGHPNFEVELNYLDTIDALESDISRLTVERDEARKALAGLEASYRALAYDFCYEICGLRWNDSIIEEHTPLCQAAHRVLALLPAKDGKVENV